MKAILTYHSIDGSGSVVSVAAEAFRRQVAALQASGVRFTRLAELTTVEDATDRAALTFDDGFLNFATDAWPVLREASVPVMLFVATEHVGRTNDWASDGVAVPNLPLLDWDQLGRLAEEGVEIGSHSRTHADLRRLDGAALEDEIAGAADRIERELGRRPDAFAYPFGRHSAGSVEVVRRCHRVACTTELRVLRSHEDPHRLPRLDAFYLRNADRLAGYGTAAFDRYITVRSSFRRARRLIMGE